MFQLAGSEFMTAVHVNRTECAAPVSQAACEAGAWDTAAVQSEVALQGVGVSEPAGNGTLRVLPRASWLRQVPRSPFGNLCSRAEQSVLVPWLLGLHCNHKLNYNCFGHGQSSLQMPFMMQQDCPSVGQDPPSVPQAGSVITPGLAAGVLLTLWSFPVILPFLHKTKIQFL